MIPAVGIQQRKTAYCVLVVSWIKLVEDGQTSQTIKHHAKTHLKMVSVAGQTSWS